MKKDKKEKRRRIIAILLVLILAILAYLYFVTLKSGGGIVNARKKQVGGIEFLFSVYGPGRGEFPRFKDPMSVATDKDNNIYVTDTGNNRVVVFDRDGNFMYEFGSKGVAHPTPGTKATWSAGKFAFPYGIDVESETGNIFVADMVNRRIQIFDNRGKFLDYFPKGKLEGFAADIFPTDIAVEKGKVYVCNPYQIMVFSVKGKLLAQIGMPGDTGQKGGSPKFDRINGIDVGSDGTIYVADSNNLRLQAVSAEGIIKWIVGKPSAEGASISQEKDRVFGLPRNVSVGPDGNIYVADPFHFQIKVFAPDGKQLAAMGRQGTEDGYFDFPNGIEITGDKIIYVVDKRGGRVQAVRLTGFAMEDPLKM